jgi:branched-chain amino acid transport system substrate-binding protein
VNTNLKERRTGMKKSNFTSLLIMILVSIILVCISKPALTAEKPVKIGIVYGLTGVMAPSSKEMVQALKLAIEDLLGPHVAGRPVEYKVEDDNSVVATAMDKVRKLVEQDKVDIIFGPLHGGISLGTSSYLDKMKVPLFVPFCTESLIRDRKWAWTIGGSILQAAYPMGLYADQALPNYRTCAVIASDRAVGHLFINGFMEAWKPRGGKVVQEQYFPEGTTDFTPYLAKLNKDVDFLCTWIGDAHQISFFPQYKESGLKLPIIQPEFGGPIGQPGDNKELGDSIIGVITTAHWVNTLNTKGTKEFAEAFKARWGKDAGPFAGVNYAMAQVFYDAVKRTGGNTKSTVLRKAIQETSLDTIIGHLQFTSNRAVIAPMHVVKVAPDLSLEVIKSIRTQLSFDADGKASLTEVK